MKAFWNDCGPGPSSESAEQADLKEAERIWFDGRTLSLMKMREPNSRPVSVAHTGHGTRLLDAACHDVSAITLNGRDSCLGHRGPAMDRRYPVVLGSNELG